MFPTAKTRLHLRRLAFAILLALLALPVDASEPEDTVRSFHEAMRAQDREALLELLAPEVVILEHGGFEASRDEYAAHHLGVDMEFAATTSRKVVDSWSDSDGLVAWVLSATTTRGRFRGRDVSSLGVETVLLKRIGGKWLIVHVHWSSRSAS